MMFKLMGMRQVVAILMESALYFTLPLEERKDLAKEVFIMMFNAEKVEQ